MFFVFERVMKAFFKDTFCRQQTTESCHKAFKIYIQPLEYPSDDWRNHMGLKRATRPFEGVYGHQLEKPLGRLEVTWLFKRTTQQGKTKWGS
jgi:hypothetical protein